MGISKHRMLGILATIIIASIFIVSGTGLFVSNAKADEPTSSEATDLPTDIGDNPSVAPKDYVIKPIDEIKTKALTGQSDVLIVQDVYTWGMDISPDAAVCEELGISYTMVTSTDFTALPLSELLQYKVIILANDQIEKFYNNLYDSKQTLADYVYNGGVLSASFYRGWNVYLVWQQFLPGGIIINYQFNNDVDFAPMHYLIANPDRPVSLIGPWGYNTIIDRINWSSMYYWTNLPVGSTVVAQNSYGNSVIVEYSFGSGKVMAVGIPIQFFYRYKLGLGGTGCSPPWDGANNLKLLYNEIEYQIKLSPNIPPPPPPPPVPWSFAVITDLHIGWGIPDYGNKGYTDPTPGEDYYITDRLRQAIQWINNNHENPDYNIKFVVVDGDIADTAELSEFVKARDILNELEIPYIPIIGNHDIWPYTQRINGDPDTRRFNTRDGIMDGPPLGEQYFEQVFWQDNPTNRSKITTLFGQFLEMQDAQYLQDYAFSYGGTNFIALDFASRNTSGFNEIQVGDAMAVLHQKTMDWFGEELENNVGETVPIFAHHPFLTPFEGVGCFWPWDRLTISNYIRNCNCDVFDFGGHTHINNSESPGGEYDVIETEAVLQPRMINYVSTGEFIRLVEIEDENINYETLISISPPSINPFFKVSHESLAVGQEITFMAYTRGQENRISSFSWDFGDGERVTTSNPIYKKTYTSAADREVTLTATDINGNSESLSWILHIQESANGLRRVILPVPGLVPLLNGGDIDLTQVPQNTASWAVITKVTSPGKPIAGLLIHFDESTDDVDLSNLIADTDMTKKKSVIHMGPWPEVIDKSKVLFIPSTGVGSVYVCPNATSLEEVSPLCKDITVLDIGETENGMTLTSNNYYGPEYYLVLGVKGTGGGEFGTLENSIKGLNDYIQGLPDGAFKNNPEQRKKALWNKLDEVWSKIDSQEYQEAINKLQNDVRAKADGDKKAEDWITNPEAQQEICRMVDELITYISGL